MNSTRELGVVAAATLVVAAVGAVSVVTLRVTTGAARAVAPAVGPSTEAAEAALDAVPGESIDGARSSARPRAPLGRGGRASPVGEVDVDTAQSRLETEDPFATGESEFHARFLRAADADLAALQESARDVVLGDGPDAEKVALLRVLGARTDDRAAELHLLAIRELPDESDRHGESVPSTALHWLQRRASDPGAREALRRVAFEAPLPSARLRGRAATSFFLAAGPEELHASAPSLLREVEPLVLACALEALERNPNPGITAPLLARFGRSPSPATTDSPPPRNDLP